MNVDEEVGMAKAYESRTLQVNHQNMIQRTSFQEKQEEPEAEAEQVMEYREKIPPTNLSSMSKEGIDLDESHLMKAEFDEDDSHYPGNHM